MADRFKFAEVRQQVIEMLKTDLLGPSCENEILSQNPRFEYIVGMSLLMVMQIILRVKKMIMNLYLQIDLPLLLQ